MACLGLHLLNGLLLFPLLRLLLADSQAAFVAALIFLWHPVQVQSVAWVSQMSGLMGTAGILICLRCFMSDKISLWKAVGGWAAFSMAVFSKETAIVLPLILMLFWKTGRSDQRRYGMGVLGIAILYLACRQAALGHVSQFARGGVSWMESIALGLLAFPVYLGKIIWPVELRASYGYPLFPGPWAVSAAAIVLIGCVAAALYLYHRERVPAQALGSIFIGLLPFLGIVPIRAFVAERFLYIPMAGVALLVGWIWHRPFTWRPGLALWAVYLGVQTARAVPAWQNEQSLWRNAVQHEPSNAFAHACYAQTLGETPQAEIEYFKALLHTPSAAVRYATYTNLASLHHRWGHAWKAHYWRSKVESAKPVG